MVEPAPPGAEAADADGTLGCLVITADKGLAGAYNHNVLKEAQRIYEEHPDTEFFVIGEYGRRWFTQKKLPMADSFRYTAQNPSTYRAQQIARDLLDRCKGPVTKALHDANLQISQVNEVIQIGRAHV